LPEGKPFFAMELIERLGSRGISLEEAERDFEAGWDSEGSRGFLGHRYGRLALYGYRAQVIMGRPERVVVQIWLPGE